MQHTTLCTKMKKVRASDHNFKCNKRQWCDESTQASRNILRPAPSWKRRAEIGKYRSGRCGVRLAKDRLAHFPPNEHFPQRQTMLKLVIFYGNCPLTGLPAAQHPPSWKFPPRIRKEKNDPFHGCGHLVPTFNGAVSISRIRDSGLGGAWNKSEPVQFSIFW